MPVLKDKQAGIFKIKVNVGEFFGMEDDELYIELREPTTDETISLSDNSNPENPSINQGKVFDIIPNCIIDHNFLNADESKMSKKEVWDLIKQRSGCAMNVVEAWSNNIPLSKRKQTQ